MREDHWQGQEECKGEKSRVCFLDLISPDLGLGEI